MKNPRISPRVAVILVAVAAASVSLWEWRALSALEHPPLRKTNCITCHADAKTLKKMAEKAGDDLYLVHRGDLKAQADSVSAKTDWGK
jgi:mono/diheme cytochrome c family protein